MSNVVVFLFCFVVVVGGGGGGFFFYIYIFFYILVVRLVLKSRQRGLNITQFANSFNSFYLKRRISTAVSRIRLALVSFLQDRSVAFICSYLLDSVETPWSFLSKTRQGTWSVSSANMTCQGRFLHFCGLQNRQSHVMRKLFSRGI